MAKQKAVTIWSILALCVLVVGGGGTLLANWAAGGQWVESGMKFDVSQRGGSEASGRVELPAGQLVVFFESDQDPPSRSFLQLYLTGGPDRERLVDEGASRESTSLGERTFKRGRRQGVQFFVADVISPGVYDFRFINSNIERGENDEVAFNKNPRTKALAAKREKLIKLAGFAVTGGLVVLLYVIHGLTLSRRGKHSPQEPSYMPDLGEPLE